MTEDRYLVPGAVWLLSVGVAGLAMWIIGIVTAFRIVHWLKGLL